MQIFSTTIRKCVANGCGHLHRRVSTLAPFVRCRQMRTSQSQFPDVFLVTFLPRASLVHSSGQTTPACTPSCNAVFSPEARDDLKSAVDDCLQLSPVGNCSRGKYGAIGNWDVSRVTDMKEMFYMGRGSYNKFNTDISKWDVSRVTDMMRMFTGTTSFNGDISKWDVSRVADMAYMFASTKAFDGDISKWDVSRVTYTMWMFKAAKSFNGDISKWDVSRVTNMNGMFFGATSFNQILCGQAWVNSKARQMTMFDGSLGSICGL